MSVNGSAYDQYLSQFHAYAAQGDVEGILSALKGLPDINATNARGWTALMFAARNGHRQAVRVLLDNGSDPTAINSSGQTAKDIAEFWLHTDVVAELSHPLQPPLQSEQSGFQAIPSAFPKPSNYFCDSPLDRMSHRRSDTKWLDEKAKADDTVYLVFVRLDLLVHRSAESAETEKLSFRPVRFRFPQLKAALEPLHPTLVFLGAERSPGSDAPPDSDQVKRVWFAVDLDLSDDQVLELCPDAEKAFVHPRFIQMPRSEAAIVGQARSVLAWHDRYRFCPTCGGATEVKEAGYKRTCINASCRSNIGVHNTCYPRTDPTVIIAVVSPDRQKLLLGRGRRFPGAMYSCLAGFMEPGEGIEEACRREVFEESAVRVGHVEYHSCQPWPMPGSLMIGCIGQAETTEIKVDKHEMEDVRWFNAQDVRLMLTRQHQQGFFCPPSQAIAHQLIKHALSVMSKL